LLLFNAFNRDKIYILIVGCWLLAVGCWLLAVGCWLLAVAYFSLCNLFSFFTIQFISISSSFYKNKKKILPCELAAKSARLFALLPLPAMRLLLSLPSCPAA
jgi:hypothetical protein